MKRGVVLKHEFVGYIPDELEQGTLYISIRFATASHLCCCGCANKVVTPIRPTDWKLIFDGKTVSLHPSIGNWSFPCQSHYWIRNNRIEWAPKWSRQQIEHGRFRDSFVKEDYFGAVNTTADKVTKHDSDNIERSSPTRSFWQTVKKWFSLREGMPE
jgi:hypothetical protein